MSSRLVVQQVLCVHFYIVVSLYHSNMIHSLSWAVAVKTSHTLMMHQINITFATLYQKKNWWENIEKRQI